jgi:nicotinate-nucleotide pyrophosphorylase
MTLQLSSLEEILRHQGCLIIPLDKLTTSSLKELATEANASGAHLTIKDCGGLNVSSMKEIAALGNGHVTFDVS